LAVYIGPKEPRRCPDDHVRQIPIHFVSAQSISGDDQARWKEKRRMLAGGSDVMVRIAGSVCFPAFL